MQSIKNLAALSSVALLFGVAGCTPQNEVAEQQQDLLETRQAAMQEIREAHRQAMQEIAEARADLQNAIAQQRQQLSEVERAELTPQPDAVVIVPETRSMGAGTSPAQ